MQAARRNVGSSSTETSGVHSRPADSPSLFRDLKEAPVTLWRDVGTVVTSRDFFLGVGGSAVLGKLFDSNGTDDFVEREIRLTEHLSPASSDFFGAYGEGSILGFAALSLYGRSLVGGREADHRAAVDLCRTLAVTGATTGALKLAFQDDRPNGGGLGFPSGHTLHERGLRRLPWTLLRSMGRDPVGHPRRPGNTHR
jgi:hypothetical protein